MSLSLEWDALIRVIVVGLLVGAGLPTLFALGVRLLSPRVRPDDAASPSVPGAVTEAGNDLGEGGGAAITIAPAHATGIRLVGAVTCFVVVGGAIVTGIVFIVLGGH